MNNRMDVINNEMNWEKKKGALIFSKKKYKNAERIKNIYLDYNKLSCFNIE